MILEFNAVELEQYKQTVNDLSHWLFVYMLKFYCIR